MKKVFYIITAVALMCFASGCNKTSSVEKAVENCFKAMKEQNYKEYVNYFDVDKDSRETMVMIMQKEQQLKVNETFGELTGYEITGNTLSEDGTTATVVVKYTYSTGREHYDRNKYHNRKGHWLKEYKF